ncbi:phosphatidylglycerophosphatase A [Tistrella sp. BH-R2-4]|uniref:Phosphatidylglycerophosphatase A n=1 Tax=Tistrella arctica TaxID=3133430 RepID=A0ABU9YEW5_9PROT
MSPRRHREHLPRHHPAELIATVLGSGNARRAPGTVGSVAALFLGIPVAWAGGAEALLLGTLVAILAGWWAIRMVTAHDGIHDPGRVVIDELAGLWITLAALAPLGRLGDWLWWLLAFIAFRTFDIAKPFPVGWADRHVRGALGVILDDLIAGVYAAIVLGLIATGLDAAGLSPLVHNP